MEDFGITAEEMLSEGLVDSDYFYKPQDEELEKKSSEELDKYPEYELFSDGFHKLIEGTWVKIDIGDVPEELLF